MTARQNRSAGLRPGVWDFAPAQFSKYLPGRRPELRRNTAKCAARFFAPAKLLSMPTNIEHLRNHEIPGYVAIAAGNGGLPKIIVTTKTSRAEVYPLGAHVTHFQKGDEPPLLF